MYTEFPTDINRPTEDFNEWALGFDAWLDTPAGSAWLDNESDAAEMRIGAERYNIRPGFISGGRHAHG